MTTHPPALPIEVDSQTSIWTTDALPMLYVPQHFFVNNHIAIEKELGAPRYADILYQAGLSIRLALVEVPRSRPITAVCIPRRSS